MSGAGRIPKHAAESNEGAPTSANGMKRWWWRYSTSAQRVSPPPRFLLVLLLSAQIMFLAIVRLGPSASTWGGQGAEGSILASPNSLPSLSRNSVFMSGISMESQGVVDKENKEVSEPSSLLSKKHVLQKKKHTPKQKTTGLRKISMKGSMHLETEKNSNVARLDQQKGSDDTIESDLQEVESRPNTKEHFDELFPSVDDKFLVDTAITETSPFDAEANLGSDDRNDSPVDSSTPALIKSEGDEEVGVTSFVDTTFSSMRKAQSSHRVKHNHDQNAGKIKQVVTGKEAQTEPDQEKIIESTSTDKKGLGESSKEAQQAPLAEVVEEATIDASVESQSMKLELQLVATEGASENAASMTKLGEEEVASDASVGNESTKQEVQPVVREEASENATSMTKMPKEERHAKESQTTTLEKVSEQGPAKEEAALVEQKVHEEMSSSECNYGYIYVYDLPPAFNRDIISNCTALNPWLDVCSTLLNGGLGESLGEAAPLGQVGSWFASDHFTAEIAFHNRILQHACLTDKMDVASAFYMPFYAGLDVGRYLISGATLESRDRLSNQFADWLIEQPAWKKSGGLNHFMMIGRITWDFRRSKDEDWGSAFFNKPIMQNITKLLIERNPWDNREMAVPYPTNFHPQSDADLAAWQNHIRGLKRNNLFSFAGAPRDNFPDDFRRILFEQCRQAKQCQSLDCSNRTCDDNQKTLEFFMGSTFCLQPRGDSFTRRSTFDCLLAGTIPVFFWHRSAYMQFEWHLPADVGSYSVFISKQDMRNGTKVENVLQAIAPEKVQSMQEAVIQLIPKVVYAVSGFALKEKDAFDVAIEGVMRSLKGPNVSLQR